MKKMLLATSALLLSAGVAAADYKIGGTGRVGLVYNDPVADNENETTVNMRLRFNFDAFKELDSGVTLGGRIRMQYDQGEATGAAGEGGADLSAAYLYAEVSGFRVEVGNVNTAFDSLATLYNAEFGFVGTTQGSYNTGFNEFLYESFATNAYPSGFQNRMGLFASYTVGDLGARVSYVTPDQRFDLLTGEGEELSVSFDYKVGQFSFGAGFVDNAGFVEDRRIYALLAEYAINDTSSVGLQYVSWDAGVLDGQGFDLAGNPLSDLAGGDEAGVTLYGRTEFSGVEVGAFISTTDNDNVEDDVAGGIGASYDLGGATLAGTIQKGFNDNTYADIGIRFSF